MTETPAPIPAATLILMRRTGSAPELLAMERAAEMAFAPGAIVFPGGRVDDDDRLLAERLGASESHAAARITAIRETIEEVGVAAGFAQAPDPAQLAALRTALREGAPFSSLVADHGLTLDLGALTPFAHWCPPFNPIRRFDTLFFIAEGADDVALPETDQAEAVHSFWASARHIIDEADAGRLNIIFPTRRNLDRLAQFASIEEVMTDTAARPLHLVEPRIEERDGERWLCIPEGIGYPITSERLKDAKTG